MPIGVKLKDVLNPATQVIGWLQADRFRVTFNRGPERRMEAKTSGFHGLVRHVHNNGTLCTPVKR